MIRKTLSALPILLVVGFGMTPFSAAEPQVPHAQAGPTTETITLKIEGWTCASCEKDIRRALLAVSGVRHADVNYAQGGAVVDVEPGHVTGDQLVKTIAGAGNILSSYQATVVPNGSLAPASAEPGGVVNRLLNLFR